MPALKDGRLAGETANEVTPILVEPTAVKNPDLMRMITPTGMDPNGRVNIDSLQRDLDFYVSQGLVQGKVSVASIVEAAIKALGPFKP